MSKETNWQKDEIQVVVFKLGQEEFTLPIDKVQEIIMPQKTTHLPNSPSFVEGVINLRGHIIPVIDGRKKFSIKFTANSADCRIIVVEQDHGTIGLIVDAVAEVIHLKTTDIEPPPIDINETNNFIIGVGKYKESLLIILDPSNFLSSKETEKLKTTLDLSRGLKAIA